MHVGVHRTSDRSHLELAALLPEDVDGLVRERGLHDAVQHLHRISPQTLRHLGRPPLVEDVLRCRQPEVVADGRVDVLEPGVPCERVPEVEHEEQRLWIFTRGYAIGGQAGGDGEVPH